MAWGKAQAYPREGGRIERIADIAIYNAGGCLSCE